MAWPQRTYRDAPQDVLTGAPVVTAEPSAQQLASRVADGAARATGDRPANDPDWWVRRYIEREQLDVSGALPSPLMLRKEAASFPDSLADVRTEAEVREILEDFNRRVKVDRLRPAVGNLPPLLARTVDVDDIVEQWRRLRESMAPPPSEPVAPPPPSRPWWRRRRDR